MIRGKHIESILHAIFWMVFFALVIQGDFLGKFWDDKTTGQKFMLLCTFPFIFNVNVFWLIPSYLKPKQWLRYGLMLILVILIFEVGMVRFFIWWEGSKADSLLLYSGNLMLSGLSASFVYRFGRDWLVNLNVIEKLEAEKVSMELAFLKSQVDPHFLFNTLNSLYALALEEKAYKTADGVTRLGTLMRYNLHDSQVDQIPLVKELDYIEKYIALQRLRLTDEDQIQLNIHSEAEQDHVTIAPVMLIPFVENAMKHGIGPGETKAIHIDISYSPPSLRLDIRNPIVSVLPQIEKKRNRAEEYQKQAGITLSGQIFIGVWREGR